MLFFLSFSPFLCSCLGRLAFLDAKNRLSWPGCSFVRIAYKCVNAYERNGPALMSAIPKLLLLLRKRKGRCVRQASAYTYAIPASFTAALPVRVWISKRCKDIKILSRNFNSNDIIVFVESCTWPKVFINSKSTTTF